MNGSPALLDRIARLAGCQGHWLLIRDGEPERDCSHQWPQSPDEHLATCLRERWRGVSLGFVPSHCGYSDYSGSGLVGKANFNCLNDPASTPDPFGGILTIGYGWNGRGIVLDVLSVPENVIETIEALESYPLIDEDEYSKLEYESVLELWGDSLSERVCMLQDLGLSVFAARRDSAPCEIESLWESLSRQANEYPV